MAPSPDRSHRLETRVTDMIIRLTFLGLLVYWSLSLMRPFLPIFIWAVILTVALFPVYGWLARILGGRYRLAALTITTVALLVVLGPVAALSVSLVDSVQAIAESARAGRLAVPAPPPGVAEWPLIGERVQAVWSLAATSLEEAIRSYGPVLRPAGERALFTIAAIGGDMLRFVLAVLLAGFLFRPGEKLASGGRKFAGQIIAPRGAQFVDLAGATIRNVSRGVVGVALLQAILAGITLQVAAVPGAGLLAFAILILCIIQIGPVLIVVPTLIWAWMTMTTGPALVFTLVLVPITLMDNVLKPILMARGLSTPTLVIFLGVIGGTLTYGLIGLFLGPIILAVFYDLLISWANLGPAVDDPATSHEEEGQT